MNTIDALNIFYREDVISDFLKQCFMDSHEFLNTFLSHVSIEITHPCIIENRVGLGKTIGTPDMIIVEHAEMPKVIVIENKLGTGEGLNQTARYESKAARKQLLHHFNLHSAEFHFIFLTLDSTVTAHNTMFKSIYYHIFTQSNFTLNDPVLSQIFNDFKEKLTAFYTPVETPLLSLSNGTEMDNVQRMICFQSLLFDVYKTDTRFELTWGEVGGTGRNNFLFMITKPHWKQQRPFHETGLGETFFIHIDVYINMLDNKDNTIKDIGIRFETYPYVPHKNIKHSEGYDAFLNRKAVFKDTLYHMLHPLIPEVRMRSSRLLTHSVPLTTQSIEQNIQDYKEKVYLIEQAVDDTLDTLGYDLVKGMNTHASGSIILE